VYFSSAPPSSPVSVTLVSSSPSGVTFNAAGGLDFSQGLSFRFGRGDSD
jgi:hypothetical protein